MFHKKQIFQLTVLKKLLTEEHSCVNLISTTKLLELPPYFFNDVKKGIFFMLNKALKKYDQHLNGILIGYQNVKILMDECTGLIPMGVGDIRVNVSIEFYVFQPKIGSLLKGIVNKVSTSHIGCLVHKYFNASILKPIDVEFEDWECKNIKIEDAITLKVSDLDFTGVVPSIEENVEFENELLKSEDFWNKKLNKNWLPEMTKDNGNSEKNSRKRTFSTLSSSSKESFNNSNNEKDDIYSHKRKKRKKHVEQEAENFLKQLLPENNVTESKEENYTDTTNHCSNKEKYDEEKTPSIVNNNFNEEISSDTKAESFSPPYVKDKIKQTTPKGRYDKQKSPPRRKNKKDVQELKKNLRSPEAAKNLMSPNLSECGNAHTDNALSSSALKKSKEKKENLKVKNVSQVPENIKRIAPNGMGTSVKFQEKQNESDSGVGLEPKERLFSPILGRSTSTKKETKYKQLPTSDEIDSFNKDKSNSSSPVDVNELQRSLIRQAMLSCDFPDKSKTKSKNKKSLPSKDDLNSHALPLSSSTPVKPKKKSIKDDKGVNSNIKKQNINGSSKNDNAENLMKSLREQMLMTIQGSESDDDDVSIKAKKENSISSEKKKIASSSDKKLIKKGKGKKATETELSFPSQNTEISDVRNDGESAKDAIRENLVDRLKQEQIRAVLGGNKSNSISKAEKKVKKNKDKKKGKEDESVAGNFSSLYSKLLEDAISNMSCASVDESSESDSLCKSKSKDSVEKKSGHHKKKKKKKRKETSIVSGGKESHKIDKKKSSRDDFKSDLDLCLTPISPSSPVSEKKFKSKKKKKLKEEKKHKKKSKEMKPSEACS